MSIESGGEGCIPGPYDVYRTCGDRESEHIWDGEIPNSCVKCGVRKWTQAGMLNQCVPFWSQPGHIRLHLLKPQKTPYIHGLKLAEWIKSDG